MATNTFGLSISAQFACGIAMPLPTAVDPNFSRLASVLRRFCVSILKFVMKIGINKPPKLI